MFTVKLPPYVPPVTPVNYAEKRKNAQFWLRNVAGITDVKPLIVTKEKVRKV
jgi:hypothetical protein